MTPKQEMFALAVASGVNRSEAYRRSYGVGSSTKAATVHRQAFDLMQNGQISARIAELRKPVLVMVNFSLERHLEDLKILRNAAAARNQFSAAVAAEVARGRHSGVVRLNCDGCIWKNSRPQDDKEEHDFDKLTKEELRTLLALLQKAEVHSDRNG